MLEMLTLELKIGDQHTHTWFVWALHLFIVSVFSSAFAAMKSEGISLFSRTTHRFGVGPYNSRTFAVYSDWDLQQWELRGCSVYKHVQRITFKYNLSIAPHQIMESLSMLYNIIFLSFVILPGGVCVSSIQLSFNDIIYVHHFYWLRSFVFFFFLRIQYCSWRGTCFLRPSWCYLLSNKFSECVRVHMGTSAVITNRLKKIENIEWGIVLILSMFSQRVDSCNRLLPLMTRIICGQRRIYSCACAFVRLCLHHEQRCRCIRLNYHNYKVKQGIIILIASSPTHVRSHDSCNSNNMQ